MDPVPLASIAAAAALLVVLAVLGVVVVLVARGHRRLERRLSEAHAEMAALRSRLDELTSGRSAAPTPPAGAGTRAAHVGERAVAPDFLITSLSRPAGGGVVETGADDPAATSARSAAPLTGREFASVAVGESLLRLVTLAHGVRRAASAENRNRIAFEMRREVKRSRRQRRRDARDTLRTAPAVPGDAPGMGAGRDAA